MHIKTRDFGELDISENVIISFPNGVYAFEEDHRFVLLSPCGENKYPMWLQSIDNENLCFIVFDPREFVADYTITIDDESRAALELNDNSTIDYLALAVIPEDYTKTTLNLKSPVVINSDINTAVQVIAQENYPIKFPAYKKEDS
ncbi:MAG: flagellar assembly protein FliW [Oscillospiraceae bacterium]|nr:flagellar assembly protein FliW [Oscillospiraceae bacterium]